MLHLLTNLFSVVKEKKSLTNALNYNVLKGHKQPTATANTDEEKTNEQWEAEHLQNHKMPTRFV